MYLQTLITLGALALQVRCLSAGLFSRSDPQLLGSQLTKRANPIFQDGNYGENEDGDNKRDLLERAIPDVYRLVSTALIHWSDDIFTRWFPLEDKIKVVAAFTAIIPDHVNAPDVGGDLLGNFLITPIDLNAGLGEEDDYCAAGADAYTVNQVTNYPQGDLLWSMTHFCDQAFAENQAPTLDDLDCEDFLFGVPGRYRITDEMDTLGATMLHEMIHLNAIGKRTGLTQYARDGSLVSDISNVGIPWSAYHLKEMYNERPDDLCILNADNYVWFALESYWTQVCLEQLSGQDGRFDPPQPPEQA